VRTCLVFSRRRKARAWMAQKWSPWKGFALRMPRSGNYDGLNRRITMIDPLDKMTQYFYDPVGNLLRVLDRNGNPTTYT
jgi:hypothetical protein